MIVFSRVYFRRYGLNHLAWASRGLYSRDDRNTLNLILSPECVSLSLSLARERRRIITVMSYAQCDARAPFKKAHLSIRRRALCASRVRQRSRIIIFFLPWGKNNYHVPSEERERKGETRREIAPRALGIFDGFFGEIIEKDFPRL